MSSTSAVLEMEVRAGQDCTYARSYGRREDSGVLTAGREGFGRMCDAVCTRDVQLVGCLWVTLGFPARGTRMWLSAGAVIYDMFLDWQPAVTRSSNHACVRPVSAEIGCKLCFNFSAPPNNFQESLANRP